jgi:hypothetical protein
MVRFALSSIVIASTFLACGSSAWWSAAEAGQKGKPDGRASAIARAQVWSPTNVAAMDIKTGPARPDAFPFRGTVTCDYLPKQLSGASPKFACRVGDEDELKVKFGGNNAEVYAEVAATRLLWALGFGADQMYPVRVICRRCPATLAGMARDNDEWIFDPASVERKLSGRELPGVEGWSWKELDTISEESGGAPKAHRDALKLLAVFLQHTDTKAKQQRLLCLDEGSGDPTDTTCSRPLMMMNDLGLTFGRANTFNVNQKAMHLVEWSATPVWRDTAGCVGNLPKSFTGTLDNPVIGEEGRQFLADLLTQLTDEQIGDLFEVSRVTLRLRDPMKVRSGFATVAEWVSAFKQKRAQITDRRCA